MGGGLMQLVAYGAQDQYLTGNPQITFFKVVYRRHTNFSLESIEQTFNGTVGFGRRVTCGVSRNGDLLTKAYLKVTLPKITVDEDPLSGASDPAALVRWVDNVGHRLIKSVDVEIGGQRIDKHYGEWLHIWNELTQTTGHALGYNRMVGESSEFKDAKPWGAKWAIDNQTMYIPLQFWFNRTPGLALPLIALQYHEVKINFEFASKDELVYVPAGADPTKYSVDDDLTASLYIDYIYLDTDERKRFAQVTHEYLIEQLQFTGAESITTNVESHKCKLNFNHPVKELIWTVRDNAKSSGPDPFDFSTNETNPVKSALLQLNGHDRFSRRDGMYFNLVQPYQHHENVPSTGINVYSFAIKPEEHQPSGTCNMSRIDNATLSLELQSLAQGGQVSVYATNYNVLRCLSGMGGLAYAS